MIKNSNISPYNNKYQRHGYWEMYSGTLLYSGYFKNDNYVGLWEYYHSDGAPWVKQYYNHLGNLEGIHISINK